MKRSQVAALITSVLISAPCVLHAQPSQSPAVTVGQTIDAVLNHHRAIKVLQENRDAVNHEMERARAGWGPRVDINAAYGVGVLDNSTTRGRKDDERWHDSVNAGVTLTQPLWDGWATRARVRSTESTMESLEHRIYDNATSLALDGIIAHIDVIRRRYIYDISQTNVDRHNEILAQTRDRASLGADTMADVTQAESRLARALSSLSEARASLRQAEETYYRLTGMRVPVELVSVPTPEEIYTSTKDIMDMALDANPKLLAYIDDISVTKADVQLAKSAYHPIINLEAGPNYSDRGSRYDAGDDRVYSMDVMAVLRWNIFNSGADRAAVKATNSRVRQARQYFLNALDDISQEIENTWIQREAAREQLTHYTDAVGYNEITLEAYKEQFILGQRSLLDVLDAESELYNSSTQVVTAESNIIIGSYRLLGLTGHLLPRLGIRTDGLALTPAEEAVINGERYETNGNPWGNPWGDRDFDNNDPYRIQNGRAQDVTVQNVADDGTVLSY